MWYLLCLYSLNFNNGKKKWRGWKTVMIDIENRIANEILITYASTLKMNDSHTNQWDNN